MMTAASRNYRLDTVKTIMIMGIVVEHSILIYGYPRSHELFWCLFISWLMPLFTMISGYLFKRRSVKELLNKYLYPMLIFSAVNFLVGYLFYDQYHDGLHVIGYAMWYLWALFCFAIFTPPILRAINVNVAFVLSLAIALVFMVIPLPSSITMLCYKLQINRIIGFYPFFLLGIILKKTGNLPYVERNSKLILVVAVTIYLLLCYANEGLAYQGSFYLQPQSGFRKIVLQMMSYLIIMPLCVTLVCSMPRKEVWFSRFGSRTLNVYLLHMLVVFPVCYGIFSHLGYSVELIVLNCMLAFSICLLFFSATVDRKMKYLFKTNCWAFVLSLYVVSLFVVNSHYLFKLF